MPNVNLDRTINISVSVRIDQYKWLKANKFNRSKLFQEFVDKQMKK